MSEDVKKDVKKITPEELEDVQKVRSKYQEITIKLGQIQIKRMQMANQLDALTSDEEKLRLEWTKNTEDETTAIQNLQEKYRKVNINLDSGEINES